MHSPRYCKSRCGSNSSFVITAPCFKKNSSEPVFLKLMSGILLSDLLASLFSSSSRFLRVPKRLKFSLWSMSSFGKSNGEGILKMSPDKLKYLSSSSGVESSVSDALSCIASIQFSYILLQIRRQSLTFMSDVHKESLSRKCALKPSKIEFTYSSLKKTRFKRHRDTTVFCNLPSGFQWKSLGSQAPSSKIKL